MEYMRMAVNDPISDMLTRIRNAGMARKSEVIMPSTNVLAAIAKILKEEGYIADFEVVERRPQNILKIQLQYGPDQRHTIRELKRISKPGLRVYAGKDEIPRVKSGLGIAIVSTPQGVLTGYEARRRGIGGEVLCTVF
jgi:small subunit ribosomal protein S8